MPRAVTKVAACLATALFIVAAAASSAHAQTAVLLPDTSQTTLMTATVSEQARITVPAAVSFTVTNVGNSTSASAANVVLDRIVLATATKQLKVSIQAAAGSFTAPVVGAITWAAGDISWNAPSWTRATGAAGILSASSFTQIATCDPDAPDCSTTGLVFTLAAKPSVQRAGNHTLVVTWKVESIGS